MARKPRNIDRSWFGKIRGEFARAIQPFVGQPITYVEVGVWRGESLRWVLENVLTHELAFGIGIDPYLPGHNYGTKLAEVAYEDAKQRIAGRNARLIRGRSQDVLREWQSASFSKRPDQSFDDPRKIDFLYLDGAHDSHSIVLDFCYAWPHLKAGSVIQFDDYGIGKRKGEYHVPAAVDAILKSFGRWLETPYPDKKQFTMRVKEYPVLGAICK